MYDLLEPKEITIDLRNGKHKTFIISKFPALAGRKIICVYTSSGIPKIGNYGANEEILIEMFNYVAIKHANGSLIRLSTRELIDSHVYDWETSLKIEDHLIGYNCSFFPNGRASTFLTDLVQNLPALVSKMLIHFSEQLSPKENTPSQS